MYYFISRSREKEFKSRHMAGLQVSLTKNCKSAHNNNTVKMSIDSSVKLYKLTELKFLRNLMPTQLISINQLTLQIHKKRRRGGFAINLHMSCGNKGLKPSIKTWFTHG